VERRDPWLNAEFPVSKKVLFYLVAIRVNQIWPGPVNNGLKKIFVARALDRREGRAIQGDATSNCLSVLLLRNSWRDKLVEEASLA
jgi:hypothetical protein